MVKFILCLHISVSILTVEFGKIYWTFLISSISELFNNSSRTNFFRVRKSDTETVFSATPTGYNSRWDAINVGGCLLGRFFSKITEFQPNFFSNIKKLPKLLLTFFSIFFPKNFFMDIFFYKCYFGENFVIEFFWRKFVFSQNYLCEDFFHNIFANFVWIWCLRNNVFCRMFYSKLCLLRIFLFCNFGVRKNNCQFFLRFFFQRWTRMPNLKMFLFWKKVKFSLIVLLDFFTRTIRKITVLHDEQRTRKIQNNMKSTTGYLE